MRLFALIAISAVCISAEPTIADVDRAGAAYVAAVIGLANATPKPSTPRPTVALQDLGRVDSQAERGRIQAAWGPWSAYDSVIRRAADLKTLAADTKADPSDTIRRASALCTILRSALAGADKRKH